MRIKKLHLIKLFKVFFNQFHRTYTSYAWYIIKHKYYVFIECTKYGYPVRGLLHDISKFYPSEFIPYAHFFYGGKHTSETSYNFERAWMLHVRRNPHHSSYWYYVGKKRIYPMPYRYIVEMICDWKAMEKTGGDSVKVWYDKSKSRRKLHPTTRVMVESMIGFNSESEGDKC